MGIPVGSILHYRSAFDLHTYQNHSEVWYRLIHRVQNWLTKKTAGNGQLKKEWFYQGGHWTSPNQDYIETDSIFDCPNSQSPTHWAMRYGHPCREFWQRVWITDIGVTHTDKGLLRITVTTYHGLKPGYIGELPPLPVPTSPGIISDLLRSPDWNAYSGRERLSNGVRPLNEGDGAELKRLIESNDRTCPVIVMTLGTHTGVPILDPNKLARCLAGNAIVYSATNHHVVEELKWLLPRAFQCRDGMIRVYQPGARLDEEKDAVRHRYFTKRNIEQTSVAAVEEILVTGIARKGWASDRSIVVSLEDVGTKKRESRIAALRSTINNQSLQEQINVLNLEIDLFEEDNQVLNQRVISLENQRESLQAERDNLEDQKFKLDRQLAKAVFDKRALQQRFDQLDGDRTSLRFRLEGIKTLETLPESLIEVVERMEQLHAGRIAFTDRAKDSAKRSSFDDQYEAWKCLWCICTHFYDMYFDESRRSKDIAKDFKSKTGFDVALTESGSTNADKKLSSLRKDCWNGREIDITPHVKTGRDPYLRVHYHADPDTKLIVVGHCGDHMDTSGTRRRKR